MGVSWLDILWSTSDAERGLTRGGIGRNAKNTREATGAQHHRKTGHKYQIERICVLNTKGVAMASFEEAEGR